MLEGDGHVPYGTPASEAEVEKPKKKGMLSRFNSWRKKKVSNYKESEAKDKEYKASEKYLNDVIGEDGPIDLIEEYGLKKGGFATKLKSNCTNVAGFVSNLKKGGAAFGSNCHDNFCGSVCVERPTIENVRLLCLAACSKGSPMGSKAKHRADYGKFRKWASKEVNGLPGHYFYNLQDLWRTLMPSKTDPREFTRRDFVQEQFEAEQTKVLLSKRTQQKKTADGDLQNAVNKQGKVFTKFYGQLKALEQTVQALTEATQESSAAYDRTVAISKNAEGARDIVMKAIHKLGDKSFGKALKAGLVGYPAALAKARGAKTVLEKMGGHEVRDAKHLEQLYWNFAVKAIEYFKRDDSIRHTTHLKGEVYRQLKHEVLSIVHAKSPARKVEMRKDFILRNLRLKQDLVHNLEALKQGLEVREGEEGAKNEAGMILLKIAAEHKDLMSDKVTV